MNLYLVGGAVRDHLLGFPPGKDLDFAVEADSFDDMMRGLHELGYRAYLTRREFVTTRGNIPLSSLGWFGGIVQQHHTANAKTMKTRVAVDFTLCREEATYHDKRHPSSVTPCNIQGDLKRRDFTVNAVAVSESGFFVDDWCGMAHASSKILIPVGNAYERFEEDPLRILRAIRFAVTRDLYIPAWAQVIMGERAKALKTLPVDRVREELHKAFAHNWVKTSKLLLGEVPYLTGPLAKTIRDSFPDLWLMPTTKEK